MVDHHGSQCGFCTPGIVMSLFALYHQREPATYARACATRSPATSAAAPAIGRSSTRRWRPATASPPTASPPRPPSAPAALAALADGRDLFVGDEHALLRRAGERGVARRALRRAIPDAVLVGGATDVGLWITKQLRDLREIIWLGRVAGLDAIEAGNGRALRIGARATLQRRRAASRRARIPTSAN